MLFVKGQATQLWNVVATKKCFHFLYSVFGHCYIGLVFTVRLITILIKT